MGDQLVELAARLQARCVALGLTVATAESCTGGLVAHALTEVPGSSAYVRGGIVAYANDVKAVMLGVPQAALDAHGAVSAQVAVAMAEGARERLHADLGVGVTGVAGPDGGTDEKPVGLVYVAVAGIGAPEVRRYLWPGDRGANKHDSAVAAIELLLARVETAPSGERHENGIRLVTPIRGAAAVGAGLAPARPARPIEPGERIHVVGAAGAGASAAALLAAWAGAAVDGCDPGGASQYTPALAAAGIHVADRHDPAHVRAAAGGPPARLSVTKALTAIDPDNAELVAARAAGVPLEAWQQVVADAAARRTLVAVAGTHGKSTTSGWLVGVLASGGVDPGAFVGALLPASVTGIGVAATARRGDGAPFVVEADEYAGNFDPYRPAVAVLTSAEWDHPDVFADREAVLAAFEAWIRRMAGVDGPAGPGSPPVLVANVADDGVAELVARLTDWPGRIVATALVDVEPQRAATFARGIADRFSTAAGPATALLGRITAADPDATTVDVLGLDPLAGPVTARLPTAGRHNASNALGVAGAAAAVGLGADAIVAGLASFGGVGRRLERKGEAKGVVVYDDYGHHPTAIRETLAAVRQREPGRRAWAVYEPLTYHRTAALLDAFADVLAGADAVAIADIWAGRDPDTTIASATGLAEAVARRNPRIPVAAPGSVEETASWLAGEVRTGDVVLVMGGGRSYRIGELLLEHLEAG